MTWIKPSVVELTGLLREQRRGYSQYDSDDEAQKVASNLNLFPCRAHPAKITSHS